MADSSTATVVPPVQTHAASAAHVSPSHSAEPQIRIERVSKSFGGNRVLNDINLSIHAGEVFSLLGGSGCGKTTLLRILAGFEQPDSGRILMQGVDITALPPYERPLNMMFQSYALFPHMSVVDNIGYGLKRQRVPAKERLERILAVMEQVKLTGLERRLPQQLSGGQRQRVALARALVLQPKVLLLDEPLSALDKKLRESTQFELMQLQDKLGITFVVVTHDQDEAMALSSRVAVMEAGHILQVGAPIEVYEYPKNRQVAGFFGTANLLEGYVVAQTPAHYTVQSPALPVALRVNKPNPSHALRQFADNDRIYLAIRPEKILMTLAQSEATANHLPATVTALGYFGSRSMYKVKVAEHTHWWVATPNESRSTSFKIDWGDRVMLTLESEDIIVLDEA
jgi:putrescine transport system ATP-binding protein